MILRPWKVYTEHTFEAFHAQILSLCHTFFRKSKGLTFDPSIKPLFSVKRVSVSYSLHETYFLQCFLPRSSLRDVKCWGHCLRAYRTNGGAQRSGNVRGNSWWWKQWKHGGVRFSRKSGQEVRILLVHLPEGQQFSVTLPSFRRLSHSKCPRDRPRHSLYVSFRYRRTRVVIIALWVSWYVQPLKPCSKWVYLDGSWGFESCQLMNLNRMLSCTITVKPTGGVLPTAAIYIYIYAHPPPMIHPNDGPSLL